MPKALRYRVSTESGAEEAQRLATVSRIVPGGRSSRFRATKAGS